MLRSAFDHARLLTGPATVQLIRLDGQMPGSRAALSAHYVGSGANLAFLVERLFATCSQRVLERSVNPLRALSALRRVEREDADLLLIERSPLWQLCATSAADISVPAWVSQVVDFAAFRAAGREALPRHVAREVARHIRRSGYELDFTRAAADMRDFFHDLYTPYVRARFEQGAILVGEQDFLARARSQTLARLRCGDAWVAGLLLRRRRDTLHFGWFGARSNPPARGASEVLDALVIEKARADGVQRVVLGHSRPSLADGVVRYKRRFGAEFRATRFPQACLNIHVGRWSDALARVLNDAALISVGRGTPRVYRAARQDGRFAVTLVPIERESG